MNQESRDLRNKSAAIAMLEAVAPGAFAAAVKSIRRGHRRPEKPSDDKALLCAEEKRQRKAAKRLRDLEAKKDT